MATEQQKAVGRPSVYSEEIVARSREYLENCKDEYGRLIKVKRQDGTELEQFISDLVVKLPSIAGLSVYLKIHRSTIYDWAKEEDKKEFSDILEEILAEQEKRLIENGLSGKYNSNIVKLALGKHGYSDKQELTGKDGKDLIPSEEDKEAAEKALKDL